MVISADFSIHLKRGVGHKSVGSYQMIYSCFFVERIHRAATGLVKERLKALKLTRNGFDLTVEVIGSKIDLYLHARKKARAEGVLSKIVPANNFSTDGF